jgi:hypothetical protein
VRLTRTFDPCQIPRTPHVSVHQIRRQIHVTAAALAMVRARPRQGMLCWRGRAPRVRRHTPLRVHPPKMLYARGVFSQ